MPSVLSLLRLVSAVFPSGSGGLQRVASDFRAGGRRPGPLARGAGRGAGIFFEVEDSLLRRFRRWFTKNSLGKVWRNGKKQYLCGPVRRERGRGEGTGAAGRKKLFEKFFSESLAVRKKGVLLHPRTEEGGRRPERPGGRVPGRGGSPGREPGAEAERRVH